MRRQNFSETHGRAVSFAAVARRWKFLLALLSGVLFACAFPDYGVSWLIFVAFLPVLVAVARASGSWEAFFLGWAWQTTAWLVMVPWVVRVMSHYGGLPVPVGIALYTAMALFLGLFGALFTWIVHRLAPRDGFGYWLLIPAAWAAVELLRTYLFTGFPWNLIAAAIVNYTPLIQIDRVAGPYLVGSMIVLPATAAAWWIVRRPRGIERVLVAGGVIIMLFVWWATGLVGYKLIARPSGLPTARAALLQPNISQEMRWNEENLLAIYKRMMQMTGEAIAGGAQVVVWPESTVPLSYSRTDFYRQAIEEVSRRRGVDIILGSVAEDPIQPGRLWNSAFLVSGGKTVGHYDKIRLVPFGEYVPLRKMLFFAQKLVKDVGEFEFGSNDQPLRGRFAYGPAICYEVVFPSITRTQVVHGADVLVTITNDAWYDGTSAPRQHFDQARLRAVEDDRYLLRAGTTGISALVDPTGRVVEELPMGAEGIIYADFQPRHTTTPYVRFGDWYAWLALVAVMIGMAVRRNALRENR